MVQTEDLNDTITSYIVSDWFLIDGVKRHVTKIYKDNEYSYYCDGKYEGTFKEEI